MLCDVCRAPMALDVIPDTFRCGRCGFYKSVFPVRINEGERIDEVARETALKPLRSLNFRHILDEIRKDIPPPASVLDVGSAHGWFLEEAEARGYNATGIEPDAEMAHHGRGRVIHGFFPDAVDGRYDIIIFNDVFEHLPHPNLMARAIADRLKPAGCAIINLPVSSGLVFRAARVAATLGVKGPLERM